MRKKPASKRISYKEMQSSNQLSTYFQTETMQKNKEEILSRQRCKVCNNVIAPSNINGDPDKCNNCDLNGKKTETK